VKRTLTAGQQLTTVCPDKGLSCQLNRDFSMEKTLEARIKAVVGYIRGFSLIELMVVVAIVALLVALALPGYRQFVRKSQRGEAQQMMMNHANLEEIWRANNNTYADETGIAVPVHADGRFNFFIRATASSPPVAAECAHTDPTAIAYTVVACAQGDQANDQDQGVSCARMSLDQANTKLPAQCW